MPERCLHRGEMHIERFEVKLGKQYCQYCGAVITIKQSKLPSYAFIPPHNKPRRKR